MFAGVFLLLIIIVSYDIATHTTFPGAKPQLRERILDQYSSDSLSRDSISGYP